MTRYLWITETKSKNCSLTSRKFSKKIKYESYVEQYGHNYAPQHINDEEFKSDVISSIDLSITENKCINGEKLTKHFENAKKLINYNSGTELMAT